MNKMEQLIRDLVTWNKTVSAAPLVLSLTSICERAEEMIRSIDSAELIELNISDDEFNSLAKMAHAKDITFNELIMAALENLVDETLASKPPPSYELPIEKIRRENPGDDIPED